MSGNDNDHASVLDVTGVHEGHHLVDIFQLEDPRIDPGQDVVFEREIHTSLYTVTAGRNNSDYAIHKSASEEQRLLPTRVDIPTVSKIKHGQWKWFSRHSYSDKSP